MVDYPLLARQFGSSLLYAYLTGWKGFGRWLCHNSLRSIPIAAGAKGMGCIGYPDHPVWEVTSRCNLRCLHCHVGDSELEAPELSTSEAKKFIAELRRVKQFKTLVFTGGEPLVRQDIFELLECSQKAGFINIIATNATLIKEKTAQELKKLGVRAVAVSLDSSESAVHNKIRNNTAAFASALDGISALAKARIPLQINVTAMEYNISSLEGLLELAKQHKALIVLIYQLVSVGRGCLIKDASLDINQNEFLLKSIHKMQKQASAIIEPVAGPQYWPYLLYAKNKKGPLFRKLAEYFFHGCCAGRGFVYIKANGDVWPCPFINISAGNIREQAFPDIWHNSEIFLRLRNRERLLQGKCGKCEYSRICGGCRGRSLAHNGDVFAEDPSCFIKTALSLPQQFSLSSQHIVI